MEDLKKFEDEPSFSLGDFKKWMRIHENENTQKKCPLFGIKVESKINSKRLLSKIQVEEGNLKEVAKEFKKYGGIILESYSDNILLIEVDSGSFKISKSYIRKVI